MTENQWWAIESLLSDWYGEICDECEDLSIARGSSEITNEIKKILDTIT